MKNHFIHTRLRKWKEKNNSGKGLNVKYMDQYFNCKEAKNILKIYELLTAEIILEETVNNVKMRKKQRV